MGGSLKPESRSRRPRSREKKDAPHRGAWPSLGHRRSNGETPMKRLVILSLLAAASGRGADTPPPPPPPPPPPHAGLRSVRCRCRTPAAARLRLLSGTRRRHRPTWPPSAAALSSNPFRLTWDRAVCIKVSTSIVLPRTGLAETPMHSAGSLRSWSRGGHRAGGEPSGVHQRRTVPPGDP